MIRTCAALSERNTDAEAVMDLLALDEIVPRNVSRLRVAEKRVPTSTISTASFDDADTALALVSEAGLAIQKLETDSREAITRAANAAFAVKEKLDQAVMSAEQAEATLQRAESRIEELSKTLERAGDEIASLNANLSATEQRLRETTERAVAAENHANDASSGLHRIITAIQTELPIVSTEVTID